MLRVSFPRRFMLIGCLAAGAAAALSGAAFAQQSSVAGPGVEIIDGHPAVAHRVLFAFASKAAPSRAEIGAIKALTAASYMRPVGGAGTWEIDSPTIGVRGLMALLSSRADVVDVAPDLLGQLDEVPNDTHFSSQWGLEKISAPTAWNTTVGNRNVVVADIDSGAQYDHPDLAANIWAAPSSFDLQFGYFNLNCPVGDHGFEFLTYFTPGDYGCDPADYTDTSNGLMDHGTATAGIIGAVGNNGAGVAGVNWTVSIVPIKACADEGTPKPACAESDVIDAIEAAIQLKAHFGAQANIVAINMSFSLGGANLEGEMSRAQQYGIMFAAATGDACNSGADAPASFYLPNEVAVAASDPNDNRAGVYSGDNQWCSNGGGQTAAPGIGIYTTDTQSGYISGFQGTSASAPFVTGAAALVYSVCPLPPHALAEDLISSSDYAPSLASVSDSRRLDLAEAVQLCTTGTPGTGQIDISGSECEGCYGYPEVPSSGNITITIAFNTYIFYWNADDGETAIQLADAIASEINANPFEVVSATASGGTDSATVGLVSKAKGPPTGDFGVNVQTTTSCTPPPGGSCSPQPFYVGSSYTGGSY